MPNLGPFPSKEADFNLYVQTVVPYLVTNKARLLVSATNVTNVTAQLSTWNAVFPASQNRNTRTQSIIDNKDNAKAAIMATLRTIFADIPASALTVEDRNTLNIAKKSTSRTPPAVPNTKPIAKVDTSRRLEHTISFTDEDGSAAKPSSVRGCQIWFKIGDPAIDPSELSYIATDTASPYTYHFNGENAGKNVYYWLRWENSRGEVGPWSDAVMATVTG
jgi:hypothetical protein